MNPHSSGKKARSPKTEKLPVKLQHNEPRLQAAIAREPGFWSYLWSQRTNRIYLLSAAGIHIFLFLLYKYHYPLPDLYSDSQGYIIAAAENRPVYYRPFGYAHFLQLVHDIASGHHIIVALQYALVAIAAQFCFFTVDYLFRFSNKMLRTVSWLLITVNPPLLVLSNLIMSDALFTSLTVIWFSLLLWVLKKKQWWPLILQLVVLYWVFQVRYNALYYPFLMSLVLLFSPGMKLYYRLSGVAASMLIIFALYTGIRHETRKATGTDVFAGFSGWQLANNSLSIYKHISIETSDFDDFDEKQLHEFVKHFIDSIPAASRELISRGEPNSVFMWEPRSPLRQYVLYYSRKHHLNYFLAWYRVAPVYSSYARHIIRENPVAYGRWFLWGNLKAFMVPYPELMEEYNVGKTVPSELTKRWLELKDHQPQAPYSTLQRQLIRPYPVVHALLFVFGMIMPLLYLIRARKRAGRWRAGFAGPAVFWYLFQLGGMAFSVMSAMVCLRYEAVLFITGFILPLYFLDQFIRKQHDQPLAAA